VYFSSPNFETWLRGCFAQRKNIKYTTTTVYALYSFNFTKRKQHNDFLNVSEIFWKILCHALQYCDHQKGKQNANSKNWI